MRGNTQFGTGNHLFHVIKKGKMKAANASVTSVSEASLINCSHISLIWANVFKLTQRAE